MTTVAMVAMKWTVMEVSCVWTLIVGFPMTGGVMITRTAKMVVMSGTARARTLVIFVARLAAGAYMVTIGVTVIGTVDLTIIATKWAAHVMITNIDATRRVSVSRIMRYAMDLMTVVIGKMKSAAIVHYYSIHARRSTSVCFMAAGVMDT